MTAPESKTPKDIRSAMADDPKLNGIVLLMLDKLSPALNHAMDYGDEAFPDDAELTRWMNGAIFGTVAHFVTDNNDEAGLDEIGKVYVCICDVISETLDTYGRFDLDQYAQDLLERVSAEKEA